MPGGDKTGPLGQGPMTGRGAGYCRGNGTPGYSTGRGQRRRFLLGKGRGAGPGGRWMSRGTGFQPAWRKFIDEPEASSAPTTNDEINELHSMAQELKDTLDRLGQRLTQLERKENTNT